MQVLKPPDVRPLWRRHQVQAARDPPRFGQAHLVTVNAMYVVVFLLSPEFSLTNVASAIDTLRVANSMLEKPHYRWLLATDTQKQVPSSSGLALTADVSFQELEDFDLLLVCGSFKPHKYVNAQTQRRLRRFARYG